MPAWSLCHKQLVFRPFTSTAPWRSYCLHPRGSTAPQQAAYGAAKMAQASGWRQPVAEEGRKKGLKVYNSLTRSKVGSPDC